MSRILIHQPSHRAESESNLEGSGVEGTGDLVLLVAEGVLEGGVEVGAGVGLVPGEGHLEDVLVAAGALGDGVAQRGYCRKEEDQPLDPDHDAEGGELLAPLNGVRVFRRNHPAVEGGGIPAGGGEGVERQPKDAQHREHANLKLRAASERVVSDEVEDGHNSKQHEGYDGKDEGETVGNEEPFLVLVDAGREGEDDDIYEEEEDVSGDLLPAY